MITTSMPTQRNPDCPFERQFSRIAGALRGIRKHMGLSIKEVEKKTSIPCSTIKAIETGHYLPPGAILSVLARFYGISIPCILGYNSSAFDDFCIMYFGGLPTHPEDKKRLFNLFSKITDFLADED